ncbi:MAG: aminotransferase class I/II-fold pyridoxal phosphate-dependent enzyme [Polyangiaceae bacterium]
MTATFDVVSALDERIADLSPSATLAIQEQANALIAEGRQVFKLGLGQSPFPVPLPVIEALRAHAAEKDYLPVRGLRELRAAVCRYHRMRDAVPRSPDDVLIGPGSKELMFQLQICFQGEILIPTPAWVSYAPQARIVGRRMRYLHTSADESFRLRPETLIEACAGEPGLPRLLVLNYPSNPMAGSYSSKHLVELAEVCREHGIIVLSDEIYGELQFDGQHVSLSRYYEEGTIVSSGLSKWCGAGGWRLGTFTFPRRLRPLLDAMAAVGSETYSSTSAPIQYAAVRAFRGGPAIEHYLTCARRVLSYLMRWAAAEMRKAGMSVVEPAGGFYLFPDFAPLRDKLVARGILTDEQLCKEMLDKAGVAALPGTSFGMPSDTMFVRFALVDFDGSRALEAAARGDVDDAFLRQHLRPTYEAIRAVCDFAGR